MAFRDKKFKLSCNNPVYGTFDSPSYLAGDTGIACISTNKLVAPVNALETYFSTLAYYRGFTSFPQPLGTEVPIAMFADGEIISDTASDDSPVKAVFTTNGWVVDFGEETYSSINMGIPYVSEVQTSSLMTKYLWHLEIKNLN